VLDDHAPRRTLRCLAVVACVAVLGAAPAAGHPGRVDDKDHDEVTNLNDNCPDVYNPAQLDTDHDTQTGLGGTGTPLDPPTTTGGDACDVDDDADGVKDELDNCSKVQNPNQTDTDVDGEGDACDLDDDDDGVPDAKDNCTKIVNPDQADADGDFIGDACDVDTPRRDSAPAASGSSAPAPAPTPAAVPAGRDDDSPLRLALNLDTTYRLAALQAGLAVPVTCSKRCSVTSELRLGKSRLLARGTAGIEEAGRTYVFVRFVRGAMARLERARRTRAVLTVVAQDAAAHTTTTTRKLTLRP
jgi:hypothetical protein